MIATIFIVWCKSNSYYVNFCFHVSDFFLFVLFQKNSIGFLKKKCSANFQQQQLEGGFFSRFSFYAQPGKVILHVLTDLILLELGL